MTTGDEEQERLIEEIGNKLTSPPTDVEQLLVLLDKAENLLSAVEQCPPQSMHTALRPSMKGLISSDLLKHSDLDVKVVLASCLSEITRITAPEAPYDDDLMKEIFGLIVEAFKNLDDMSSRSFSKRVSMLETVAKVRSCVLMLDLECDDLILDMFHHFLNKIRSKHSYTVFSSMETIMTLVIEESENISRQLLSCLLIHVKIDDKNIIPLAKQLAEKVLVNSALKLKPYLVELFRDIHMSDYSKVVASVCHGNLDTSMQNETNSSETQADDSKFSDKTHCDELLQGSAKPDHRVVCSEKAAADTEKTFVNAEKIVADADGSSKSVISNGTFQMGNVDSMVSKQRTELFQPAVQLRDTSGSSLTGSEKIVSGATRPGNGLNLSSLKGRKRKASGKLLGNNHHNQIDDKKVASVISGRRKGRSKEAVLSKTNDTFFKELETAVCSKPGKMNMLEPTPGLDIMVASSSLHSPNKHDRTHSRKGRQLRSKPSNKGKAIGKTPLNGSCSAPGHSKILECSQITNGDLPMLESSSRKTEIISEAESNLLQSFASKSNPDYAEDNKTTPAICDSETNKHDVTHLSTVSLHIPNVNLGTHSKKGRPLRSKKSGNRSTIGKSAVDGSSSAPGCKGLQESSQRVGGDLPLSDPISKKLESISVSEGVLSDVKDSKTDPTTALCTSESKHQRRRGRNGSQRELRGVDLSGQTNVIGTKQMKGRLDLFDEDKEVKLKELLSLRKSRMNRSIKDQIVMKDSNETNSTQKCARGTQEASGIKKRRRSCNDLLVGSKIRVWWPEDESFYDGLVDSFDRISKKHKILYNDGDVEVLSLNKEKWEPIRVDTKTDGAQEMNNPDVYTSEPSNKKARGRQRKSASAEAKTTPHLKRSVSDPLKRNPDSTVTNESNDKPPKRRGRPSAKVLSQIIQNHSKSGDKAGGEKTRSIGKAGGKSKHTFKSSTKSMKEGSSRAGSTVARRGRPAKGSTPKSRGGTKPAKIARKLKANNAPLTDQANAGRAAASGANGKKRKRGRSSR